MDYHDEPMSEECLVSCGNQSINKLSTVKYDNRNFQAAMKAVNLQEWVEYIFLIARLHPIRARASYCPVGLAL
jgi:hypothetical protein